MMNVRQNLRGSVNLAIIAAIFLLVALGCSGKTDDRDIVSNGVLTFRKDLKYGSVGTHGSQGFYVASRHIIYKNNEWTPPGGTKYLDDIASCETSPNTDIKVLKCVVIKYDGGGTILIREKDGQPEIQQISGSYNDRDEGEWANLEGRWLVFRDYFVNVETGERQDIKPLPENPGGTFRSFIGMSPDMKTAVLGSDSSQQPLLRLVDINTGTIELRPVNGARNPWVFDSETRNLNHGLWVLSNLFGKRTNRAATG